MDLATVFDIFFGMMVVPCVALLVYGGWLAWCEAAYEEEDERAFSPHSVASPGSRKPATPTQPSGSLLWNRP